MRKILIVKGVSYYDNWGDETFHSKGAEPFEVDDATYDLLRKNLYRMSKDDVAYRMVEYVQQQEYVDVIASIKVLVAKDEAVALKRKQQHEAQQEKDKQNALEKKRKQLEKLKKELGESA